MKKLLYLVCLVFSLLCGTLILTGCQEKEEMYEKDGFYFPIEAKGLKVESATLMAEMTSSKIVNTDDEEELTQLLNLMCKKKPDYVGTINEEEFHNFYFDQEHTQGFIFSLYFCSNSASQVFCYSFFISTQGEVYNKDVCKNLYYYTEKNFIDYEAISIFFRNWKV